MAKNILENKYCYNSPIGKLEFTLKEDTLISLKPAESESYFNKDTLYSTEVKKQLEEYFLKKRKKFDLKIALTGTPFQKSVWEELIKIPYGCTLSYGAIAENIGNKNAYRAVGTACNKNPILIIVPCHRVVAKNDLGGYLLGLKNKKFLLELETI